MLLLLPFLFVCTCGRSQSGIIIAGSTSVQPFIEKLAEQFQEKHPEIRVNVQGGGSTAGIIATSNRTCDIGTSSRGLKPEEAGLRVYRLCLDGIAVVVHTSNPIRALTDDQIRGIFAGRIANWREVGGADKRIIAVTREDGSGTRGAFEELIMHEEAISDACLVQDSNGAVREIIATMPQGIGYISAGLIDERIAAVAIDGAEPTLENFRNGTYRFTRPFLLLAKDEPTGAAKTFLEFVLSAEAQRTLQGYGLIPADAIAQ